MAGPDENTDGLNILTIEDFTPGIWRDVFGKQNGTLARGPAPDGAATEDRTRSCISLPQGGLTGGPKVLDTVTMDAGWGEGYQQATQTGSTVPQTTSPHSRMRFDLPTDTFLGQAQMGNMEFDDPDIADWRLMDFEVIGGAQSQHSYHGPVNGFLSPTWPTYQEPDEELLEGVILAPIWNAHGIHNPQSLTRTGNRIIGENAAMHVSTCHVKFIHRDLYDGGGGGNTTEIGIWRHSHPWIWPSNSTLHASQKKYGHSTITSGFFYWFDEPTIESEWWKFGVPVLYVNHAHAPHGGPYFTWHPDAPFGTADYEFVNGNVLAVVGAIDPNERGTFGVDSKATRLGRFYVNHMVTHAGRLLTSVGPTSFMPQSYAGGDYGSYGSSFSGGSYYEPPSVGPGMSLWKENVDSGTGVATVNNARLHYSFPQLIGMGATGDDESGWKTGVNPEKNFIGLSDEGYTVINSITSVNANQLFCTTVNKGAVVVNGDLNNPSVVNLPSVESTYGKTPHPVAINGGVVYGSKSGIFLWEGGETSSPLSSQLDGEFWLNDDLEDNYRVSAPVGRLGYRAPYLFAPNGWMCDMRTNSWWKVPGPDFGGGWTNEEERWTHFRTDHDGYVWAAAAQQVADLDQWKFMTLDPDETTDNWQWHSQPLTVSRNRNIQVREVNIWATGSQLQVRLYKGGVLESPQQVINLDDDVYPHMYTLDFNVTGQNIELEIEAVGECVVYKVDIGWREMSLRKPSNTYAVP